MSHKKLIKLNPKYVDVQNLTLRDATDAFNDFLGSIRTENGNNINSTEAQWDKMAVLNKTSIEKLLVSNTVCYEAACNAEASRRAALEAGLVGGAIIGAGIIGLCGGIRRLRNKRPKVA